MCIRDRLERAARVNADYVEAFTKGEVKGKTGSLTALPIICLLYTSDDADERSCVALGGRRIIKKKKIYAVLILSDGHTFV